HSSHPRREPSNKMAPAPSRVQRHSPHLRENSQRLSTQRIDHTQHTLERPRGSSQIRRVEAQHQGLGRIPSPTHILSHVSFPRTFPQTIFYIRTLFQNGLEPSLSKNNTPSGQPHPSGDAVRGTSQGENGRAQE